MATGFMLRIIAVFVALAAAAQAMAQSVSLVGVIGDKAAILTVEGGEPKAVKVGEAWKGISVLAVGQDQATVEIAGKRRVLSRGEFFGAPGSGRESVVIAADSRGHFFAQGAVNGVPIRFLVDTGATSVSLPASEARRIGLDYRKGSRGVLDTAAGPVTAWRVRLDSVRVGTIELDGVEAVVVEAGLETALLGMSFLNRTQMNRDGEMMTLIRRF